MDYEKIKKWISENKQYFLIGACFILVFVIGFGSGRFDREMRRQKLPVQQINYSTKPVNKPETTQEKNTAAPVKKDEAKVLGTGTDKSCLIKGNISSKGDKIYHISGGAFYATVKPEQCFNTETEAQAAGFRKSAR